MNHLQIIKQFIDERKSLVDLPDTGFPFVTVSRQCGAGGHLFAYVLLTDFVQHEHSDLFRGWHVFDRQLCEVVAQDPELQDSLEALLAERYCTHVHDFVETLLAGRSKQLMLHKATFRIIRVLATLGKVIIVGRGACWLTRHMKKGVHIRLVAPEQERVRWLMQRFRLGKEEARTMLLQQDEERRKMARSFFNKDIDDPIEYDAVWNTGTVPMHEISDAVIHMIRKRAKGGVPGALAVPHVTASSSETVSPAWERTDPAP